MNIKFHERDNWSPEESPFFEVEFERPDRVCDRVKALLPRLDEENRCMVLTHLLTILSHYGAHEVPGVDCDGNCEGCQQWVDYPTCPDCAPIEEICEVCDREFYPRTDETVCPQCEQLRTCSYCGDYDEGDSHSVLHCGINGPYALCADCMEMLNPDADNCAMISIYDRWDLRYLRQTFRADIMRTLQTITLYSRTAPCACCFAPDAPIRYSLGETPVCPDCWPYVPPRCSQLVVAGNRLYNADLVGRFTLEVKELIEECESEVVSCER